MSYSVSSPTSKTQSRPTTALGQDGLRRRTRQQSACAAQIPREHVRGGDLATEIPTGIPFVYELSDDLSVKNFRFLGDPDAAAAAAEAVRRQAG